MVEIRDIPVSGVKNTVHGQYNNISIEFGFIYLEFGWCEESIICIWITGASERHVGYKNESLTFIMTTWMLAWTKSETGNRKKNPIWHECSVFANVDNGNGTSNLLAFLSTVRNISVAAVSILLTPLTRAAFNLSNPLFLFLLHLFNRAIHLKC